MAPNSDIDINAVEKAFRTLLKKLKQQGTLGLATPRTIRTQVEGELGLPKDSLSVEPYKSLLKELATRAMDGFESGEESSTIDTQDVKSDEDPSEELSADESPKTKTQTKSSSAQSKQKGKQATTASKKRKRDAEFKSAEFIEDSDAESQPLPTKTVKKTKKGKKLAFKSDDDGTPAQDNVELESEVEKPKPKKGKAAAKPRKKSKGAISAPLSSQEEEIKRLKSFVTACGVRKVWSKELPEDPHQQIRKLREILKNLGMTGRLSMEKAKQIKEKREMEKELADVQSFHEKIVSTSKSKRGARAEQSEEQESEESDADLPKKKVSNARQSIMAFLGDQSSDED